MLSRARTTGRAVGSATVHAAVAAPAVPQAAPAPAVQVAPEERATPEPAEPTAPSGTGSWLRRHAPGPWGLAVLALLIGAFLVRIWGVDHGLPYAYNADENAHFLPKAIGLFGHGWDPHYFVNPPAYTYLLHIVFAVWFGGQDGVSEAFASNPTEVFIVARVTAAVLGTLAVWLLYLAGTRFFDRRVGLLAAGLMSVAFLPVFYAHLALNDVPTLAPICLALWGTAGILRFGRRRDYAVAGGALGLAAATKYTGGIVIAPLLGAAVVQLRAPGGRAAALRGLALAGGVAFVAFVAANPYALITPGAWWDGVSHQATVADDAIGKLGLTQDNGIVYYLWALTWGLGWVPAVAALGAVGWLYRDEPRLVGIMAPGPIIFLVFMGTQARFFGRWVMPVLPMLCLLAAYLAIELVDWGGRKRPALKPTFVVLAVVLLCGQGVIYTLHNGEVLSREDTRNSARDWLVANVPPTQRLRDPDTGATRQVTTRIVVEPVVPDGWAQDVGMPSGTSNGNRWVKFPTSRSRFANDGSTLPGNGRVVNIEDYERVLRPELIDDYEAGGYCWVISGSTQRGRAEVEPDQVPGALQYYRELERRAELVHVSSPYGPGEDPVRFNFDWSFDYYPRAYDRPGPEMRIYHLKGGQCAS